MSATSMIATGVPSSRVAEAWPHVWPLLAPAYELSPKKCDLVAGLRARELQLWAVHEKKIPVAGIVTRLLRHEGTSGELHCHLWLIGGSHVMSWAPDFLSKLIPWAKAEGCRAITGNGRRGWSRLVTRFGGERIEDREGLPCWRLPL